MLIFFYISKYWKTFLLQKTRWQEQQSQHVLFSALYVIGWITVKYRILSQNFFLLQYFPRFRDWWGCKEYSVRDIYFATFTWSGRFEENTFGRCWFHTEENLFHEKRNTFFSPPFDMIRRIGRKYISTSSYPQFTFRLFLSWKKKTFFSDFTGDTHDWDRVVLVFLHQSPIPTLRLGICQKIYTTQFSGEKILHTENA